MTDVQHAELERYFSPIYYVEYEELVEGALFPHVFRFGFYGDYAKKDALAAFENCNGARVIEKSMRTGAEKIIKYKGENYV